MKPTINDNRLSIIYKSTATTLIMVLYFVMFSKTSAITQGAELYEISLFTIDSGGGQSSGGQYELTGTIGQPDAAYSAGGSYELLGGFWPGGPLCIVEFDDYARFADNWLDTGSELDADLDGDGDVDLEDLNRFVDEWLYCCPYDWPLR